MHATTFKNSERSIVELRERDGLPEAREEHFQDLRASGAVLKPERGQRIVGLAVWIASEVASIFCYGDNPAACE
jgi:hypothetical protein